MKKEGKDLLLKDLCARLPYGVILKTDNAFPQRLEGIVIDEGISLISISDGAFSLDLMECKPYLYPLSSMTEEQKRELICIINSDYAQTDWYNKNHFDYRNLISKNLAIEVTEENNPYKNNKV